MNIWRPLILFLCLSGCAGAVPENGPQPRSNYPDHWPLPVETSNDNSNCPHIDGYYRSRGHSNSTIGDRFSNPIFERSFFYLNDIADESNLFKVSHDPATSRIFFDIFTREGEILASGLFKRYSKCESGWFVIESLVEGGAGDSPVQSTYRQTSLGIGKGGSLLINARVEGVWRKYLVGSESRVSNIWYKFDRANESSASEQSAK